MIPKSYTGRKTTATELAKHIVATHGENGANFWPEKLEEDERDAMTEREREAVNTAVFKQLARVKKFLNIEDA